MTRRKTVIKEKFISEKAKVILIKLNKIIDNKEKNDD